MELCLWEVIEIKGKQGSKYTTNDKGRNCIFETSEAMTTTILKTSPRNNHFVKGPFKYYVIKRVGGWGRPNDYAIT